MVAQGNATPTGSSTLTPATNSPSIPTSLNPESTPPPVSSPTLPPTPAENPLNAGSHAKSGLSGGAVAGVAIGCLIAGAAVAAVVLILLFRRRRASKPAVYPQQHLPPNGGVSHVEKGPRVTTTAITSNVDNLIPQPVEDDAITKELSRIRDNIKNHVRTYYHFDRVGAGAIEESKLAALAAASGISTTGLVHSLADPSKRGETIRLILAWIIFSRCEGTRRPSLLPWDLASLAVSIPGRDGRNAAQSALYSKWKTITAALLQQSYGKQAQDSGIHAQSVAEAIAELDSILAPFVQGSVDGGQRLRNLEMIMSRAASFAFLLFSQPGSFRFDFGSERRGMVVFPGVQQIIGDHAQTLSPPRLLWEKEIAAEA